MRPYDQAAERMGISKTTLRRMIKRREIGIVRFNHKVRLISEVEISRVIGQRTIDAKL
jgi:excisionase family DNA binding protein